MSPNLFRIASVGLFLVVGLLGLVAWRSSLPRPGTISLAEMEALSSKAEKEAQAKALFRLAGGHHMLQDAKTGISDSSELKHKNSDALNILGNLFGSKHKDAEKASPSKLSQQRGRDASNSAGGGVKENPQIKKMKQREEMPPESPAQALQGLIAAWSGAAWWQPCGEICAPRAGASHDKAAFHKFQACEQLCRKTKTQDLKKVLGKIKTAAATSPPPHKALSRRTIQKLSKHLLTWAEGQGLPAQLADNANKNIKTNEQVGQSIAGMLIAGWSGAGWWKPCGQVCAPSPGEKRTKANFNKFMACQAACRRTKGQYLRGFIAPKEVVKHMARG
eukprot:CAMPEP_0196731502 /NCGR_PEP_ID=MMETSP1091-20130531/11208_1 /TAXON_ID=302021 /ORGANISM="Rhodomonas sp., Strain CCMP768" /LENGTH=332 /DNA_ID=CAMNT_0042074641 /DNA_START=59 /DNA_END=1057 /DNA_ORIENTATION=+